MTMFLIYLFQWCPGQRWLTWTSTISNLITFPNDSRKHKFSNVSRHWKGLGVKEVVFVWSLLAHHLKSVCFIEGNTMGANVLKPIWSELPFYEVYCGSYFRNIHEFWGDHCHKLSANPVPINHTGRDAYWWEKNLHVPIWNVKSHRCSVVMLGCFAMPTKNNIRLVSWKAFNKISMRWQSAIVLVLK